MRFDAFEVTGKLYPPGHARQQKVRVSFLLSSQLVWHAVPPSSRDGESCNYEDLEITGKLSSLEREVTLPDGSLLLLPNEPQVNRWLDRGSFSSRLYDWEGKTRYIVASVVLAPVFLFALWRYVLPAMAIQFAAVVPEAYVEMASEHTLAALDSTVLDSSELDSDELQSYLVYWWRNIDDLGLQPNDYQIDFRHSEIIGPNAFALPDGQIIITDQLVELLDGDREVLLAILLHEIGHVEHRHSMRLVAQTLVATIVVSTLFGDLSGMAEVFVGTSTTVLQNKFTQQLEWEADDYALQRLQNIPQGPENFAQAMEKLAELIGDQGLAEAWLSSHPSLQRRIDNARQQRQ